MILLDHDLIDLFYSFFFKLKEWKFLIIKSTRIILDKILTANKFHFLCRLMNLKFFYHQFNNKNLITLSRYRFYSNQNVKYKKKNTKQKYQTTKITMQKIVLCLNFLIQYKITSIREIHCISAMRSYNLIVRILC